MCGIAQTALGVLVTFMLTQDRHQRSPSKDLYDCTDMKPYTACPYRDIRIYTLLVGSGLGCVLSLPAAAELSPALDRVSISGGIFRADPKVNTTLNTSYGNFGTGDVGLGNDTVPRIRADIMIFDSQGLSFDYDQYKQDYAVGTGGATSINGQAITTNLGANLGFKLDVAKLAYKWWIGHGSTVLGLGLGAAYYKIDLQASASASINNAAANISGAYTDHAVAPLLQIGLRHAIDSEWRLFANASGVRKSGGRLSGDIYNVVAGVEWFPVKNVGVVLDYGMGQINLDRLDTNETNFKLKIKGPSTFVKVRY